MQGVSGVPAGSGGVRSSGAFDFTGHKGHLTVETGAMKLETVMIGTTIYEKVPPQLAQGAAAGKPWIKLDLADAGKLTGVDLGGLSQESSGDPSQSLALLEGASKNVVKLGSDTVRGATRSTTDDGMPVAASAETETGVAPESASGTTPLIEIVFPATVKLSFATDASARL